jgi:hypothetical protein
MNSYAQISTVPTELQGLRGIPFLEVEVDAAGRTVLCYLPMYEQSEAEKYLKRETTELKSAPALLELYTAPTLAQIVEAQDSVASAKIIEILSSSAQFDAFAAAEGADILARDTEAPTPPLGTSPDTAPWGGCGEAGQRDPDRDRQGRPPGPGGSQVPKGVGVVERRCS